MSSSAEDVAWFHADGASASGTIRRAAMDLAEKLGFGEVRRAEVGIVASELAGNLWAHAQAGRMVLTTLRRDGRAGIRLIAADEGPGIADIDALLADGTSTNGTLGIGLGAVARLSNSWDHHSIPGRGTVISATLWLERGGSPDEAATTITRAMTNESVCGDRGGVEALPDGRLVLLLADGLGHGPLAADASGAATHVLAEDPTLSLEDLFRVMDERLRRTRGAAVAVAVLAEDRRSLRFAGVGNISGWIVGDDRRSGLVSSPGIVGGQMRTLRTFEHSLDPHAVVVLHSDGMTERWDLGSYPGLRTRGPEVIGATLIRDAGTRPDDASVVVAKVPA